MGKPGIERETKRALRGMSYWRVVTATLGMFEDLIQALVSAVSAVHKGVSELARVAYMHECEHARRYIALTGLDPARADGDDGRYQEVRIAVGSEDRPEFGEDDDDDE